MLTYRLTLPLAALVVLAGCNKSSGTGDGTSNRVVEGTISDAMIAADTLTSEPPTADPTGEPTSRAGVPAQGDRADKPATAASEAPTADSAAATPAAAGEPAAAPPD